MVRRLPCRLAMQERGDHRLLDLAPGERRGRLLRLPRLGQMGSVAMCPCHTLFSCSLSSETFLSGSRVRTHETAGPGDHPPASAAATASARA